MARRNLILLLFFASVICLHAQGQTNQSLTLPPYHNLPTTEGYFQGASGVRLFYRVAGREGDPILFLHGGPGLGLNDGAYDMEPLAERGHRVLMFNERGAGRSEIITVAGKLRMQDYVQDVEEFRKKFGLEKLGIIGLSWGSAVAVNYITAYPERVTRVVFLSPMSPTAKLRQERIARLDTLKTETERRQERDAGEKFKTAKDADVIPLCEQIYGATLRLYALDVEHFKKSRTSFCPPPIEGLRNTPFVMKAAMENLGDWDFRPLMKNVHIPALVLEGAETNVPLDATREWVKSLPNARLLLIPHAGHQNWVDQPEAVISAMDEFFKGNWPAGSEQSQSPAPQAQAKTYHRPKFESGPIRIFPEVHKDRTVTFQISASSATNVSLSLPELGRTQPMEKDSRGTWSATVGPLEPNIYEYSFLVDGAKVLDAPNPFAKMGGDYAASLLEIPGDPPRFDEVQQVPHGSLVVLSYVSTPYKKVRNLYVYLPPRYDMEMNRKYPVLYLRHGSGQFETAWPFEGRAGVILENLLAQGKAVPMIIVMTYGESNATGGGTPEGIESLYNEKT